MRQQTLSQTLMKKQKANNKDTQKKPKTNSNKANSNKQLSDNVQKVIESNIDKDHKVIKSVVIAKKTKIIEKPANTNLRSNKVVPKIQQITVKNIKSKANKKQVPIKVEQNIAIQKQEIKQKKMKINSKKIDQKEKENLNEKQSEKEKKSDKDKQSQKQLQSKKQEQNNQEININQELRNRVNQIVQEKFIMNNKPQQEKQRKIQFDQLNKIVQKQKDQGNIVLQNAQIKSQIMQPATKKNGRGRAKKANNTKQQQKVNQIAVQQVLSPIIMGDQKQRLINQQKNGDNAEARIVMLSYLENIIKKQSIQDKAQQQIIVQKVQPKYRGKNKQKKNVQRQNDQVNIQQNQKVVQPIIDKVSSIQVSQVTKKTKKIQKKNVSKSAKSSLQDIQNRRLQNIFKDETLFVATPLIFSKFTEGQKYEKLVQSIKQYQREQE